MVFLLKKTKPQKVNLFLVRFLVSLNFGFLMFFLGAVWLLVGRLGQSPSGDGLLQVQLPSGLVEGVFVWKV